MTTKVTIAAVAGLVAIAAGLAPDTIWVTRLNFGVDVSGGGVASRGNAVAAGGYVWGASKQMLVVRLDQNGDTVWSRTHGTSEQADGVCIDAESNVLAAGYGSSAQYYALVAKYDSLGGLSWFRTYNGHMAEGIAADSAGNCYVAGACVVSDTSYDFWLAKLNPSGDTVWTRTFHFDQITFGYGPAVDAAGNIAACAYSGKPGNYDCLTLKFAPDGDSTWTRRLDLGSTDFGSGVAFDLNGDIIVVGHSASHCLVLKYDSSGTLAWSRVFNYGPTDQPSGVCCDSAGDIYAAGRVGGGAQYRCLTV